MKGKGPMTVDDQAKFLKQQSGLISSALSSNERNKKLEEKRIREEKL